MSEIVILDDYRNINKEADNQYICGSCSGDEFFIIADGTLECSNCGDKILNITHDGGE